MPDTPLIERDGPVLIVTIDRPKANAISNAASRELGRVFAEFRDDPGLRVAILTGAGDRFFSAGWDLKQVAGGDDMASDAGVGGFGGIQALPGNLKPIICAVNGMAVGGGFETLLAADLVIAADHATFMLPEINLGMVADSGLIRLARRLPRAIVSEILMLGRPLSAVDAARWGIVNRVVPRGELMTAARALAHELAQKSPAALAAIKDCLDHLEGAAFRASLDELRQRPSLKRVYDDPEFLAKARAFKKSGA